MNVTLTGGERSGVVKIPASKSVAHRVLITAALSKGKCVILCDGLSSDIEATIDCLNSFAAEIKTEDGMIYVSPRDISKECDLYCRESGSTLRFLLPVIGALGIEAVFHMEGRLKDRPMDALFEVLSEHGMTLRKEGSLLYAKGKLSAGDYSVPGNVSSQFVSGLLLALPLLSEGSTLTVTGEIQSGNYIEMTKEALRISDVSFKCEDNRYLIKGMGRFGVPSEVKVESDWSSAAFYLCLGALSSKGVTVTGMNLDSLQGDKAVLSVLEAFGAKITETSEYIHVSKGDLHGIRIDASEIPDLIPAVSVIGAYAKGETRIVNAARLRFKESDRLRTTSEMIKSLGGEVTELEDGLVIYGKEFLAGGRTESYNDHRIAMSAAVAAAGCKGNVTIEGAECTDKSFRAFWDIFNSLERN